MEKRYNDIEYRFQESGILLMANYNYTTPYKFPICKIIITERKSKQYNLKKICSLFKKTDFNNLYKNFTKLIIVYLNGVKLNKTGYTIRQKDNSV